MYDQVSAHPPSNEVRAQHEPARRLADNPDESSRERGTGDERHGTRDARDGPQREQEPKVGRKAGQRHARRSHEDGREKGGRDAAAPGDRR
ncbi:MAG: hypothetical protein WEA34_12825 [Gemmatimonadota bacterium]